MQQGGVLLKTNDEAKNVVRDLQDLGVQTNAHLGWRIRWTGPEVQMHIPATRTAARTACAKTQNERLDRTRMRYILALLKFLGGALWQSGGACLLDAPHPSVAQE